MSSKNSGLKTQKKFTGITGFLDVFAIFLLTWWAILFNGYYYGVSDQAVYIPFLKAFVNPYLYPNDILLTQMPNHLTYFYYFFSVFVQFGIERVFFVFQFFSLFFTFVMVFYLSLLLFKHRETAFISIFLFLVPIALPSAIHTYDTYFSNRNFTLPFLLLSIYMFLIEKLVVAFALAGLMFNFHAMESSFILFMFLSYFIFNYRSIDKRIALRSIVAFLFVAFPMLLRISQTQSDGMSLYANPQWVEILRMRCPYLFPFSNYFAVVKIFPIFLIWLFSLKYVRKTDTHNKKILCFSFAIGILCLLGTIFTEIITLSPILSMQVLRSTKYFVIFAIPYISNYLIVLSKGSNFLQRITSFGIFTSLFLALHQLIILFSTLLVSLQIREKQPRIGKFLLALSSIGLILIAVGSIFPHRTSFLLSSAILNVGFIEFGEFVLIFSFLLILAQSKYLFELVTFKKLKAFGFITVLLLMSVSSIYMRSARSQSLENDWKRIQLWCKNNTPQDSLFIIPPYFSGFRIWSERAILGDWKDGTMSNFSPSFAAQWWERMEDLGYTKGNYRNYGEEEYNSLAEFDFKTLARKYGATHVVTEKTKKLNFTLLYESDHFRIYEIRGESK